MKRAAVGLMATLLMPVSQGQAAQVDIYEHNGSVIEWVVVGENITATYSTPRPVIENAGVMPGTVLFRGTYDHGKIFGKAYAFKAGCPAAAYDVIGEEVGQRIVLRGPAPHRAQNSCAVIGYFLNSPHARLVLTYSATDH